MFDNVNLISNQSGTKLYMDRVLTKNYILDIVDFGENGSNFSIVKSKNIIGVERDIWNKTLSVFTVIGWVVPDSDVENSMRDLKMFLNRFILPKRTLLIDAKNLGRNTQSKVNVFLTQSISYGKSEKENNEEFCKFLITGVYKQNDLIVQNIT